MENLFKKGISTPIAIGIILVLALLVGGFILWQYSKEPVGEPSKGLENTLLTEEEGFFDEETVEEKEEKDELKAGYNRFVHEDFFVDYPSSLIESPEKISGFTGREEKAFISPDAEASNACWMLVEEITEVSHPAKEKLTREMFFQPTQVPETVTFASGTITSKTTIIENEKGRKDVWYFQFDHLEGVKQERWLAGFKCNDFYYIFNFECSGEGSKHYPKEVVDFMIGSITCR